MVPDEQRPKHDVRGNEASLRMQKHKDEITDSLQTLVAACQSVPKRQTSNKRAGRKLCTRVYAISSKNTAFNAKLTKVTSNSDTMRHAAYNGGRNWQLEAAVHRHQLCSLRTLRPAGLCKN